MLGGLLALAHDYGEVAQRLHDLSGTAAGACMKALHDEGPADISLGDVKAVDVELVVVLGVGDGRLQHLLHLAGDASPVEGELGQGRLRVQATDSLGDHIELLRADAKHAREIGRATWSERVSNRV